MILCPWYAQTNIPFLGSFSSGRWGTSDYEPIKIRRCNILPTGSTNFRIYFASSHHSGHQRNPAWPLCSLHFRRPHLIFIVQIIPIFSPFQPWKPLHWTPTQYSEDIPMSWSPSMGDEWVLNPSSRMFQPCAIRIQLTCPPNYRCSREEPSVHLTGSPDLWYSRDFDIPT